MKTTTKSLDQLIRNKAIRESKAEFSKSLFALFTELGDSSIELACSDVPDAKAIRLPRRFLADQLIQLWMKNKAPLVGNRAVASFLEEHRELAEQVGELQNIVDNGE